MKKALKDITKDSSIYGATNFLGKIIGFLLLPLYTNYLNPKDYGIMALLAFIVVFYVPLASLGITNGIFRRYNLNQNEQNQKETLTSGSAVVLLNAVFLLILGMLLSDYITYVLVDEIKYIKLVRITLVTGFLASVNSVFQVVLRARRLVKTIGAINLIQLLVSISASIYLVAYQERGLDGVILGNLYGGISTFCLLFFYSYSYLGKSINLGEIKSLLSYGLPFLPHKLLAISSTFLGQFFIKNQVGIEQSGLYDIALRFAVPLSFIVGAVQSAWVPIKFQIHREEGDNAANLFRNIISVYLLFLGLVFTLVICVAPELIYIIIPKEFHLSAVLLCFVLLIPFAQAIYFMLATGFEFTNNSTPLPLVSGGGLLVLAIIGLLSISYLGIYGAILGVIGGWATMAVLIRYFASSRFYIPLNYAFIARIMVYIASLSIGLFVLHSEVEQNILRWSVESVLIITSLLLFYYILSTEKDFSELDFKRYNIFGKLNFLLATNKKKK